jgi:dTDP-4-dehydrorhamnose reductase
MRVIVIGADGNIGSALTAALSSQGHVVYSTTRRPLPAEGNALHLDLTSFDVDTLQLPAVDIAFFCAAITGFSACRNDEALARIVNVTAPIILARRLVISGTKVVLLSTSSVFDGRVPHVPASRTPRPLSVYGKLKAEAEKAFSTFGTTASILRLTKVLTPGDSLFTGWFKLLSRMQSVTAYSDHRMAPITLDDAVSALSAIANSSENGLFQISGSHDISYYDAACYLSSRLGVDSRLVVEAQASENRIPPEEITHYSSLDATRTAALMGWKAPDPLRVIDEVFGKSIDDAARGNRPRATSNP